MIYKELIQCVLGKVYWNLCLKKYQADKYLFFPRTNKEFQMAAVELLPLYMLRKQPNKTIIITSEVEVKIKMEQQLYNVKMIKDRYMQWILKYYALENMSNKWKVISIWQPYRTGADKLLGIKGVTWKQIIYYDIYKLDED